MMAAHGADGGTGSARRRRGAAIDRSGPGYGDPPLLRQGGHRERRSTEQEDSHQDREGGGEREEVHGQVPEDFSPTSCSHRVLPDEGRRGW